MRNLNQVRKELCQLNKDLVKHGLVVWTSGNVSQRIDEEHFLIKPSGVEYDSLTPDDLALCNLDGQVKEGRLAPSSDTAAHAYVYKHMSQVGGIVHTHSNYASAFAAAQKPIPCALTAVADEFGGDIPLGPFASIGDDSIGRGIVETLRESRSPAVLMAQHGVFTIGKDSRAAVKTAVMCEDVAKSISIAQSLGEVKRIDQASIDSLYNRYNNVYGQK